MMRLVLATVPRAFLLAYVQELIIFAMLVAFFLYANGFFFLLVVSIIFHITKLE